MLLLTKIHILLVFLWSAKAQSEEDSVKHKEFLISHTAKLELLELNKVLIDNLKEYLYELVEKINKLQRLAREIRRPLEAAQGVEEEYLSNPLHSFPLIRHMHQDWKYIEGFMQSPVGEEKIDFLKEKLPELPWQSDTKEATESMYRIARTYNVTPWDMAHGLIDGTQFKGTLTALDCFEIGKLYFNWGYFGKASQWLSNTLTLEGNSAASEALGLHRKDVALLLARSLVEMDQTDEARQVLMDQSDLTENKTSLLTLFQTHTHMSLDEPPYLPESYAKLCRSSHAPSPSRLHCRYNTTTSPFLILAPLKMEEISLDPYIIVYHDVLSAKKIEEIIRYKEAELKPTTVYFRDQGNVKDSARTALGTWFTRTKEQESSCPLLQYIHTRVWDMTGLKTDNSDDVNFLKYGFGAHYCPHYDFFNTSTDNTRRKGDRIATVLFYLSDAPHGGATAFPTLNLKVNAERGKVLFWYNLKGDTYDLDEHTGHGACPVFHGFKFAMTVWLRELDQMFILPARREGIRQYFF